MTTTTTKWKTGGVLIPDSVGGQVYRRIKGEEGADPTTASEVLFTPSDAGYEPTLYINANTTLTLAMRLAPIATLMATPVVITLPLFYMLGYTRTPGTTPDLVYSVQRQGNGAVFVNGSNYRETTPGNGVANQTAMLALSAAVQGDWCQRTDLFAAGSRGGQVAVLTGTTFSNLAHWTLVPMATANRPNIAWGDITSQANMLALSNALPGDFCVRTDASSVTYQLAAAGPATLGNWIQRTDSDKPVDPSIKIYDPAGIAVANAPARMFPESQYKTCDVGNDAWFVR